MNNYIDLLTEEELRYICDRINGKVLRDLYKKNVNTFNKLKSGFRPDSLTDEEARHFAYSNRNAPFVANFLNSVVDRWLQEINEKKENAIKKGISEKVATIGTLANSFLNQRPHIYFKIMDIDPPIDDEELLCHTVKMVAERNFLRMSKNTDNAHSQLKQLRDKLESEAQEKQKEYEKSLETANQKVETLQNAIEQYKIKLEDAESSRKSLEEEVKQYKKLTAYVDEEEIKPSHGFDYASLCKVFTDDRGRDRLRRLADVKNGELSDIFIESAPEYTKLYWENGPANEGAIGVWDWRVEPNRKDPSKDYIKSSYNDKINPIEIISIRECNSIDDILEMLNKGFIVNHHMTRTLFSIHDGEKYEGVYCDSKVMEYKSEEVELKKDVLKLPVYTFYRNDTLRLNNVTVLVRTTLGLPNRLVQVKDPMDIVQDCIATKVTWPVSHQKGFVRDQYKQIKAFLTELQTSDLYEEIRKKCDCSVDEAIEYVNAFMNRADKIVIGDTIENDVMVQIIKNDPDAYAACMEEIRKVWEQENASMIAKAQAELEVKKKDEAICRQNIEKKELELSEIQKKISEGSQSLDQQREMAEEVENLVLQKIEYAKNHVAEFIANSTFGQATTYIPVDKTVGAFEDNNSLYTAREEINSDNPQVNDNCEQMIDTIVIELLEAGVDDKYTNSLAALLYGAYVRRVPVLLAGPNGREIADAFAIGMDAKTAAVFTCTGNESRYLDQCESSDDDIIVIENPLQAHWENNVIRLISKRRKFYILTQAFADDLVVEPKGLFNYCLPVLTELFVSGFPEKNYEGGKLSASFKHYEPQPTLNEYEKMLDVLRVSSLAKENVQALITDIINLSTGDTTDDILQLLLFSLAYATGEQHTLLEKIDLMEDKPSKQIIYKLERLIGEEE